MATGKKQNTKKNKKDNSIHNWLKTKGLFGLALLLGLLALGLMAYTYIPAPKTQHKITLGNNAFEDAGLAGYTPQNPPVVEIEYPTQVFAGDVNSISITFTPSGVKTNNQTQLVADFLLEIDGAKYGPDGDILFPIKDPYPALTHWDFSAYRGGSLDGNVWLHLQFHTPSGESKNILLLASPVEIQSVAFLGVSIVLVRLGSIFIFFSALVYLLITFFKNKYASDKMVKEKQPIK